MGCFYTGFDYKNRKNGYFKIGETEHDTPSSRVSQISRDDAFMWLRYIQIPGATKAELLYVEAYTRLKMSYCYSHVQNDHFLYSINSDKYSQALEIAAQAITYAKEACDQLNLKYIEHYNTNAVRKAK